MASESPQLNPAQLRHSVTMQPDQATIRNKNTDRNHTMRTAKLTFAAMAATAMLAASPAFAHAKLVSYNPAANATVQTAPRTITLVFSERVVPSFSKIELTMPEHGMNIPVRSAVSEDGKRIIGTLQSPLNKGSYAVHWTAAGSDGHKMEGRITFRVG